MIIGKHLIAGEWVDGERVFQSDPAHAPAHEFAVGSVALVDEACTQAEEAFWSYGALSIDTRAAFLDKIADEIEARGAAITKIGSQETGLPEARLEGERGRTTGQLRLFANHIRKGDFLDKRHDEPLPARQPLPRPDLRLMQMPVGPVAVFGASNFPLAFSTAGGDTAAALAAGCTVVVKGHSAHPGTGDIVAQAILAAIKACGIHQGVFSMIQGGDRAVGSALVQHPLISAVGFTGSLAGGRALFDLCVKRPNPIPFFGELGSVNPMFLLPVALEARAEEIATGWSHSLTMGVGQFCTNPGIAVVLGGRDADKFTSVVSKALDEVAPQTMLTQGIADAYALGQARIAGVEGVDTLVRTEQTKRDASPNLFSTSGAQWLDNHALSEEVFGPLGIIVRAQNAEEMIAIARKLEGQLTCTLHMDEGDTPLAQRLVTILTRKAGRILANGFPTGVEVADAMVHGGPYQASTNFGATSVGTMSIRRFLRPVSFQNIPAGLLPNDLTD